MILKQAGRRSPRDTNVPRSERSSCCAARCASVLPFLRRQSVAMGAVFGKVEQELPRHSVLHQAAGYCVRRYQPSIAATVSYGAAGWGERSADRRPFGDLARYIGVFSKPANEESKSISMTAPVLIDAGGQGNAMSFLLPHSVYGGELHAGVPRPTNPNVKLVQLDERVVAVRGFSGNLGASRAKAEVQLLLADLEKDGVKPKGRSGEAEYVVAGYNAPFTYAPRPCVASGRGEPRNARAPSESGRTAHTSWGPPLDLRPADLHPPPHSRPHTPAPAGSPSSRRTR